VVVLDQVLVLVLVLVPVLVLEVEVEVEVEVELQVRQLLEPGAAKPRTRRGIRTGPCP